MSARKQEEQKLIWRDLVSRS